VTAWRRWLALGAYGALLVASAPPWPDDWDGIGFVESVSDFDLARFRPHPPGYPVYVAMLRVAALVTREPMRACVMVAAASGVCATSFVWAGARRFAGTRAAWAVAGLVAALPLAWRSASGVGSEAPALALAVACGWALLCVRADPNTDEGTARSKRADPNTDEGTARSKRADPNTDEGTARSKRADPNKDARPAMAALVLGLLAGLGAGVRLSWAPIYLSLLVLTPAGVRLRAWAAAAAGTLAWAVPLAIGVGPARLAGLLSTHFAGHAARWGGTVVTDPGPARLAWLARDIAVDGMGAGSDALGIAVAAAMAIAAAQGLLAWCRSRWRGWRVAAVVVLPYLAWVALGQNLRDQPRHALPLVVLLAAGLALPAARGRRAAAIVSILAILAGVRAALDAHARRTVPPAGQQLVDLVRAQPTPERLAVFGVASVRFFETTELAGEAFPAGSFGDVEVRLTRLGALPARVWVTSEIAARHDVPWPIVPVASLCRPARLDRRAPCLDVFAWKLPYLPAP
jgi:hypothetical protein